MMNLGLELISSLDIAFVSFIQVGVSFFVSYVLDHLIPHSNDKLKGTLLLLVETSVLIGCLLIVMHYVAIAVRRIPFPLMNVFGYTKRISEWKGLTLLTVFALIYCDTIQGKIEILRLRESLSSTKESETVVRNIAQF
jgi:hypothetical protein